MNLESIIKNPSVIAQYLKGIMEARTQKSKTMSFEQDPDGLWYAVIPEWKGSRNNLLMINGTDDMLSFLLKREKEANPNKKDNIVTATFSWGDNPQEVGNKAELVRVSQDLLDGAFYNVNNLPGWTDQVYFCPVILFVCGEYPKYIYFEQNMGSVASAAVDQPKETEPKAEEPAAETANAEPKAEAKEASDRKAKIYNLIIVDESGSMSCLRESTLSGINETMNTIRSAQKEFGDKQEHFVTLVTFDTRSNCKDVRTIYDARPINEVPEFEDYYPSGCTPLYDAMGFSLTALRERIANDPDATGVVTVLTDGLENASHTWRADRLRKLIEQLKELGWSFSYMGSAHNVKEVSDLLSIDNVMEFSHDAIGSQSSWRRDSSSKRAMFRKINRVYEGGCSLSDRDLMDMKKEIAAEYYGNRVTPDNITSLAPNEVFVFGSNPEGHHNGGAAQYAKDHFGAIEGKGEGPQGQSYALPSTAGIEVLADAIVDFMRFAESHPEMHFLVTRVGCGSAGMDPQRVAELFYVCIDCENIALPREFWRALGIRIFDK